MAYMKRVFAGLALVFIALPASAERLPLWEIGDSDNRVLLMGSVHFLRTSDYPLPTAMDLAYEQADALVMEIDMRALDPAEMQAMLTSMASGSTLRDSLSDADYRDASARAEKLGIPLMLFDQFEPWFAALSITQLRMIQLGFDPDWGIESRLTEKAARDGKRIAGLETLEEQLGFMANMDKQTQRDFLMQSLDDAAVVEQEVDAIVRAWRSGDSEGMEKLMLESFAAAPGLEDALLVQRNRNWIEPLKELINKEQNYLVVVGAMHLVGENSVVAMLEDQGVEIRQLSDSDFRQNAR
jgi:uncharacterized protein YbaP (TraB family)